MLLTKSKHARQTIVLIAGAWHGAWCWIRITPLLQAAGHRVLAPDLLGMGEDSTPLVGVTLAAWSDQVARIIKQEVDPVILVGHSRSGIVISEVAEQVPERIATLVYLSGSLIPTGESIYTKARKPQPGELDILQMRADGSAMLPNDLAAATFYNTTPAEWVTAALAKLSPEPLWVHAAPLALTAERYGRVKRAYIETLRDNAVPLETQRSMQAVLPCFPIYALDSDHSPFLSQPDELAKCLLSVAAEVDGEQ